MVRGAQVRGREEFVGGYVPRTRSTCNHTCEHYREIDDLLPNNQRQRRTCYALRHTLYPVSAAHMSNFRMDSNSTFLLRGLQHYRAHPWSPFHMRRAHPGPGPHTTVPEITRWRRRVLNQSGIDRKRAYALGRSCVGRACEKTRGWFNMC